MKTDDIGAELKFDIKKMRKTVTYKALVTPQSMEKVESIGSMGMPSDSDEEILKMKIDFASGENLK